MTTMSEVHREWLELGRRLARPYERPANDQHWAPDFECASREALHELQGQRLSVAYRYLWERSPFYRRKFQEAGLGPDSVRSREDLLRVPPTHREEWLADQERNPPWGSFSPLAEEDWLSRGWMLFTTSGTVANAPRVFRHTTFDRDMWTWHGARALHAMGIRPGRDVAINCFGYGTSVAFWGLHYALNHMGIPVIPGGGSNTHRRIFFIEQYKPTVLLCTPSYASYLGRTMQDMGKDPAASSIRWIVAAGEPGPCVPATKDRIERLWGAKINDDFGCTEVAMSPFGYTCAEQVARTDGRVDVHLMEDVYVAEVLDRETWKPVAEGERGVLVVSNLFSEAQPILRYVMGDWTWLSTKPCICGRTHARAIGGLHGRSDQLIKIRGLLFFPAAVEDAVRAQGDLGDEFTVEITRENDLDRVLITVEPASQIPKSNYEESEKVVARQIKGALGIEVDVKMVPYGTLPRTEFKARRLFDRR
jgi:phenylacetate-CoA ligase